jgi:roadblock/LC7 domain-containing protein
MARWYCGAVSSMLGSMVCWTFSGGEYTIAVDGNQFVIAETAKIKSFDELCCLLHERPCGQGSGKVVG